MEEIFNIENFNIIEDEENYYFFRALNMADNQDLENGTILDGNGNIERIRTDRERYEENAQNEAPKYSKDAEISLEQVYDHIKMHYRKDTNCISLSSNGNVSISYGRGSYKDRYVMIKVPKRELGEKVINAGQYMLGEIAKRVNEYISSMPANSKLLEAISEIDNSKTAEEIRNAIETRYTSEPITPSKAKMRKGITYRSPVARISNYQALNEEQSLEKNKIIAKLTLLERVGGMAPLILYTANNNLLIQTIGNAFSSLELVNYGEIEQEKIIDVPKEIVDIFSLLQQVEVQDQQVVRDLKIEVINFASSGRSIGIAGTGAEIEIPADSILGREYNLRDNISIEEMYNLTDGKVEYGQANSIVKNLFYLARSQSNARELAKLLNQIVGDNPKYRELTQYIENNGFRIEPEIITRRSKRGVKLSESVSLNLNDESTQLIDKIKGLSEEDQIEIMENGGLTNVRDIMSSTFSKAQRNEQTSKEEYYAEAIFSLYNWGNIGIEEFTPAERNNLIQRIQNEYCVELYQKLEEQGIDRQDIPTVLLNMVTRRNDFEITENDTSETIKAKRLEEYDRMIAENVEKLKRTNVENSRTRREKRSTTENASDLQQDLSIERIERFLGYYDVQGTGIQLRPYQQRAKDRADEILQENRFASVILPTGGGKSFVALSQMMEHQNEEILYLAPQNEILEQMKDNIIEYIHGPVNTIQRNKDDIIADVFPNLTLAIYPSLLARKGRELIDKQYGFIVLDELHRTGAEKWGDRLSTLLDNQPESTRVLGITATPRRDADGINMANEIAQRLGYTNREAVSGKHIAMNISITNAIRMGLVVNPKLVSCAYSLKTDGSLEKLKDKIEQIEDVQARNERLEEYEALRRNVENAEGIPQILQANVKKGGKYIVFLPIIEDLEDEDGNVIGRKKGKDKIEEYEKQIAEYFKGSNILPHFHSMLGEYGDKENARRLEEFQNANTEETEFMLVMNKANEGLHLDKLNGIIWLRPMDENSRILYLQQLGRGIYSEDPDNPTKDEDRPVVIDLVNNTLKVNWENEITEQDDIQMLNLIINWSANHSGRLPDINSTDKEETGYANLLKEIQGKYKKYLENGFDEDELEQKQIEEIEEIIRLGGQIDLWRIELPDRIARGKGTHERGFTDKNVGPFELTGLLKDFVELEDEVENELTKPVYEQVIEFIETHRRMMKGGLFKDGKRLTSAQMSEEQKEEVNLYARWKHSDEYKILKKYAGQPIENVPEEYREKIKTLREYGIEPKPKQEKTTYELVIEFLKNHGRIMKGGLFKDGKQLTRGQMSEEQREEANLYDRWIHSEEYKILQEYAGIPIEDVSEEYREKISTLRQYGLEKKTTYEQVIEFIETNGRIMKTVFFKDGKQLTRDQLTEEQREEANLYARWWKSEEYKILQEYAGQPIERVPEEYREKIATLRNYGIEPRPKQEKTIYEQVIEFIESHGRIMKSGFKKDGKQLTIGQMSKEQKEESRLYGRWVYTEEYKILQEYAGQPIERVPEEYREKIAALRNYGIDPKPKQEKTTYEQVIEFIESHGRIMKGGFKKDGKQLTIGQMSEEQKEESRLYGRWKKLEEYKILQEYAGQPIENVPEEYREKIETLRKYGLEPKLKQEKTTYEQVIEFIETHGRIMKSGFKKGGQRLTSDQMAEEQREEANLYARWNKSDEYKILQEYAGQPIESVPEEYREKISTLRQYGLEPKKSTITSKEIAEASISSLTNQEMTDTEDVALKELVERTKEGGMNIDEQS